VGVRALIHKRKLFDE
jgi:hypothetical protein